MQYLTAEQVGMGPWYMKHDRQPTNHTCGRSFDTRELDARLWLCDLCPSAFERVNRQPAMLYGLTANMPTN